MMKMNREEWGLTYHGKDKSLTIAEPSHRIGPLGVSSGVSMRENDLPISSVQQVKNICLHYVKKCSGKYVDNKMAARYVHQMADEVIGQLSGVTAQIRRYESEPEIYQGLLNDWKEIFPASLGSVGTPKAIAAKLKFQQSEIVRLNNALQSEEDKRKKEVSDVLRSMDSQLVAYRDGIMNERCQIAVTHDYQLKELEGKLDRAHQQAQAEIDRIGHVHLDEIDNLKRQFDQQIGLMKGKLLAGENAMASREREFVQNQIETERNHQREIAELKLQIMALEEKLIDNSGIIAAADDDSQSVVSLTLDLTMEESFDFTETTSETSEAESEASFSVMDEEIDEKTSGRSAAEIARAKELRALRKKMKEEKRQRREEKRAEKAKRKAASAKLRSASKKTSDNQPKKKSIRLTGAVADGVKALKSEIESLKQLKSTNESVITTMDIDLRRLSEECSLLHKRLKEVDSINEELRKALRLCLNERNALRAPGRKVNEKPYELCHTPHFLGKPDRSGLRKNKDQYKISAYPTAGYF